MLLFLFIIFLASTGVRELETTNAERKVDVRIFNHGYTASQEEVESKLHRAALAKLGYKKTIVFSQSTDDESGKMSVERKIIRFQKRVPCQDMMGIEEEIRKIMPGVWGNDVREKVREEAMKTSQIRQRDAQCDAGIEIHFPLRGCPRQNNQAKRVPRGCDEEVCLFCFFLTQ